MEAAWNGKNNYDILLREDCEGKKQMTFDSMETGGSEKAAHVDWNLYTITEILCNQNNPPWDVKLRKDAYTKRECVTKYRDSAS